MSSRFSVVIPARFASSRLPGKILADIGGKSMLEHVYRRAQLSAAQHIVIATDHQDIFNAAQNFGADVVMTSPTHPSGTDRLQEVCSLRQFGEDELVVNIQGDEPLIPPTVIDQVARLLATDEQASVATLCEDIDSVATFIDPNVVKVVMDNHHRALYFSRAPIPWPRDEFTHGPKEITFSQPPLRHLGIYAYRVALLNRFVTWPMATLEQIEKLEQLRVLANGEKIALAKACDYVPAGVDTQADLDRIRALVARS